MAMLSASRFAVCFGRREFVNNVKTNEKYLTKLWNCNKRKYSNESTRQFTYDKKKSLRPAAFLLLAVPIATFGLGTWQVKRRKWKLNLIKSLHDKTTEEPVDFPFDLDDLKDLEYRRVRLQGTFDHRREIYITPRSLVTEGGDSGSGGLISSPRSGSLVITPFTLSNRDLTILVNRGWVPRKKTLPQSRPEGQIDDEIELIGVVRHSEKQAPFVSNNDKNSSFWHWRDVEGMAEKCGTAPYFLDAVIESTVPGGPIGGQTRISLRNEHFSYILTWYSLSAATLYLWYRKFIRGISLM